MSSSDAVDHSSATAPSPGRASNEASVTAVGIVHAWRPIPESAQSSPFVPLAVSQSDKVAEVWAAPVVNVVAKRDQVSPCATVSYGASKSGPTVTPSTIARRTGKDGAVPPGAKALLAWKEKRYVVPGVSVATVCCHDMYGPPVLLPLTYIQFAAAGA